MYLVFIFEAQTYCKGCGEDDTISVHKRVQVSMHSDLYWWAIATVHVSFLAKDLSLGTNVDCVRQRKYLLVVEVCGEGPDKILCLHCLPHAT